MSLLRQSPQLATLAIFATLVDMTRLLGFICAVAMLLTGGACAKPASVRDETSPAAKHAHHAPHGGTPVVLGKEVYHLELVLDPKTGRLSAYVLDGEMENFVRISQPTLEIVATIGAEKKNLTLAAVANPATGETVGSTSLFETQAAWLKSAHEFDAVLTRIEVRSTTFNSVEFNFPKGNDRD